MAQTPALYYQDGQYIDYTPSGAAVDAGQVVLLGTIPCIAPAAIADGVKGSLAITGLCRVPQMAEVITAGDAVYWDATGTPVTGTASTGAATAATSSVYIMGVAVETTAATDSYVKVALSGAKRTATVGGAVTASDIEAEDASLNMNGIDAAQGGAIALAGGTSATTGLAGGAVSLAGGVGGATGAGGAASVTGGVSGATSGTGGAASLTGGAAGSAAGNAAGGTAAVAGGLGKGTGDGGAVGVTGGVSGSGATGAGGAIAVAGGAAASTNGAGGAVSATGGLGKGTGAGGAASLVGGVGGATGNGGAIAITGGASAAGATGTGGAVAIAGGANANTTDGAGGAVTMTGGAGKGTGAGGGVGIAGGAAAGSGNGGAVVVTTGASGSGIAGNIHLRAKVLGYQGTPETAADTASLSDAQMLSGILVGTPTAAAAYTVRTGTQIEAALGGTLATGDSFDLTVVNLGGAGDIITMTAAAGCTFVGCEEIDDDGADITPSGTFRFVRGAANTFVAYRIG